MLCVELAAKHDTYSQRSMCASLHPNLVDIAYGAGTVTSHLLA